MFVGFVVAGGASPAQLALLGRRVFVVSAIFSRSHALATPEGQDTLSFRTDWTGGCGVRAVFALGLSRLLSVWCLARCFL